jgi:hypothetical protein
MTETQHVGTLKTKFLHYITIKMVLVIFHCQNSFIQNSCLVLLLFGGDIYRQQAATFSALA